MLTQEWCTTGHRIGRGQGSTTRLQDLATGPPGWFLRELGRYSDAASWRQLPGTYSGQLLP